MIFQGENVATEQFRSSARWLHVVFSVSLRLLYFSLFSSCVDRLVFGRGLCTL